MLRWWLFRCKITLYHRWSGSGSDRRCTVCGVGVYGDLPAGMGKRKVGDGAKIVIGTLFTLLSAGLWLVLMLWVRSMAYRRGDFRHQSA